MQISKAGIGDLAGIRSIWEEQFTTDGKYLEILFGKIMPQCTSYVCKENGAIVSALSLMPMVFINDITGTKLNGWYMFGVATLKKFWGKKIAAQAIEYACTCMEKDSYSFIFERPATQSLNNYYSKLGFSKALEYIPHSFKIPATNSSTGNISAEKSAGTDTCSISKTILKDIRNVHRKRFEWGNIALLESLIELGELDFHNATYCITPPEGTFISIRTLNSTPEEIFNGTFFCFPME